ncbi:hypothetical protein Mlute_02869 [Meiothermus luteus]|uniref:Uncharacterized protein n=1 Tax=Meiothermus luteus TaxID=2026184 RepID=A0A399EA60_9DEIN|nr:hypothetical protein Mlute_02869 [Meiothermus luteus]
MEPQLLQELFNPAPGRRGAHLALQLAVDQALEDDLGLCGVQPVGGDAQPAYPLLQHRSGALAQHGLEGLT